MSTEIQITPKTFDPIRERFMEQVDEAAYKREVSYACQILSRNDYLAKSEPSSILMAVLNVAQIGLSLDPVRKLAYLVPRYNRKIRAVECALEPSYQGLVKLWTDTGSGKGISAQLIWEGDEIEVDLASAEKVKRHAPYMLTGKAKGRLIGVYSLATMNDGTREIELMSAEDVYAIRERSESYKKSKETPGMTSTWASDEGEMFRKTVIRRHFKYLTKTDRTSRLAQAISLDETDYVLTDPQWNMIDRLLHTAQISDERRTQIEREFNNYTSIEASRCIEYLKDNQPPDFMKHLRSEIIIEKTSSK